MELVSFTNDATGVQRYVELSTGQAFRLLNAEPGDHVPFLGHEYTVTSTYGATLALYRTAGRYETSFTVDLAVDEAEARQSLRRVA